MTCERVKSRICSHGRFKGGNATGMSGIQRDWASTHFCGPSLCVTFSMRTYVVDSSRVLAFESD